MDAESPAKLVLVFSTYVEVILVMKQKVEMARRVLHVCGGDPSQIKFPNLAPPCSPRMWR